MVSYTYFPIPNDTGGSVGVEDIKWFAHWMLVLYSKSKPLVRAGDDKWLGRVVSPGYWD